MATYQMALAVQRKIKDQYLKFSGLHGISLGKRKGEEEWTIYFHVIKKLPLEHEDETSRYITSEEKRFFQVWSNVNSITKKVYFPKIITALKEYLTEKFYYSNSSRYDEVYQLMWDYSENMSYQDFYQAWNS